jgi:hypothetical protein
MEFGTENADLVFLRFHSQIEILEAIGPNRHAAIVMVSTNVLTKD